MKASLDTTLPADTATSRDRRVLLAAGAIAAAAGLGVAWWKSRPSEPVGAVAEPVPGFWAMQWETPQGGAINLQSFRGRPLLINFWATWCPPCVEELPLIDAFFEQNKGNGWQVIGLAVDKLSSVQAFLQKTPLHFPVGLAGLSGAELGRSLGNLTGGLPFSVALGANGAVIQRKMGRLSKEDLAMWAGLK
jgi:thiol-disulfide isomerase/thioredoxin